MVGMFAISSFQLGPVVQSLKDGAWASYGCRDCRWSAERCANSDFIVVGTYYMLSYELSTRSIRLQLAERIWIPGLIFPQNKMATVGHIMKEINSMKDSHNELKSSHDALQLKFDEAKIGMDKSDKKIEELDATAQRGINIRKRHFETARRDNGMSYDIVRVHLVILWRLLQER